MTTIGVVTTGAHEKYRQICFSSVTFDIVEIDESNMRVQKIASHQLIQLQ
jgi:hypothetical protein